MRIVKILVANGIMWAGCALLIPGVSVGSLVSSGYFVVGVSIFFAFLFPIARIVLAPLFAITFGVIGYLIVLVAVAFLEGMIPGISVTSEALALVALVFWVGNRIIQ